MASCQGLRTIPGKVLEGHSREAVEMKMLDAHHIVMYYGSHIMVRQSQWSFQEILQSFASSQGIRHERTAR